VIFFNNIRFLGFLGKNSVGSILCQGENQQNRSITMLTVLSKNPINTCLREKSQGLYYKEYTVSFRSKTMANTADFCEHPDDVKACLSSLIKAYRENTLSNHCIFEGLREDLPQCRDVLQLCLDPEDFLRNHPEFKPICLHFKIEELQETGKLLLRFGYPQQIEVLRHVFFETFSHTIYSAVRHYINKKDVFDADDAYQNTCTNLHKHLLKGDSIKKHLRPYIYTAAKNECYRVLKSKKHDDNAKDSTGEPPKPTRSSSFPYCITSKGWEHCDKQVQQTTKGDIINRIIIGQRLLLGSADADSFYAKYIKEDWERLAKSQPGEIEEIYDLVQSRFQRPHSESIIFVLMDLLNEGLIEPYQVPIGFAIEDKKSLDQTREFLHDLGGRTPESIPARMTRLKTALAEAAQNHDLTESLDSKLQE
jgi:hypothetical protein